MKKFYQITTFIFLGVVVGLFIGVKYLGDKTIYTGKMRLKQKGEGHTMNTQLDILLDKTKEQLKKKKKELRKAKRDARKSNKD